MVYSRAAFSNAILHLSFFPKTCHQVKAFAQGMEMRVLPPPDLVLLHRQKAKRSFAGSSTSSGSSITQSSPTGDGDGQWLLAPPDQMRDAGIVRKHRTRTSEASCAADVMIHKCIPVIAFIPALTAAAAHRQMEAATTQAHIRKVRLYSNGRSCFVLLGFLHLSDPYLRDAGFLLALILYVRRLMALTSSGNSY
jgi:hypothetical protein